MEGVSHEQQQNTTPKPNARSTARPDQPRIERGGALIELLWLAGNNPVSPESVHTLLEPIAEEIGHVRSSMADMRL